MHICMRMCMRILLCALGCVCAGVGSDRSTREASRVMSEGRSSARATRPRRACATCGRAHLAAQDPRDQPRGRDATQLRSDRERQLLARGCVAAHAFGSTFAASSSCTTLTWPPATASCSASRPSGLTCA
eukprot:769707-Prymnesium_polylepis.1